VHPSNAKSPIVLTEFPIVTDARLLHDLKAHHPIDKTEFGIFILVRLVHPSNAKSPIVLTEFPIVTDARLLQFLKASSSINVTESGMIIEVKFIHPWKI